MSQKKKKNSDGPASEIRNESYAPLYSVKQSAHCHKFCRAKQNGKVGYCDFYKEPSLESIGSAALDVLVALCWLPGESRTRPQKDHGLVMAETPVVLSRPISDLVSHFKED